MDSVLIIVLLIALVVVAFWVKTRRLRGHAEEITKRFRESGAVRENKAKTLTSLGLDSKRKSFSLMRDQQAEALSQLLQKGIISQAPQKSDDEEARFYLDTKNNPML